MTNKTPKPKLRIGVDCDETLWINGNYGPGGKPNDKIVRLFRLLQSLGHYMIVWSAGGKLWAEKVCDHCNIKPDECRDKPSLDDIQAGKKEVDLAIDDCEDCGILTLFV